jgi:anthranilate synthase component I
MFNPLSYETFSTLAKSHQSLVAYRVIAGDKLTPVNAFLALRPHIKSVTLLESNPQATHSNRYSYLCFDPICEIKALGEFISIDYQGKQETCYANPFEILRAYQKKCFSKSIHPLSGFVGGLVGLMSYDAIRSIESIPDNHPHDEALPDFMFRSYKTNISFDHQKNSVVIATRSDLTGNTQKDYEQALSYLEEINNLLFSTPVLSHNTFQFNLDKKSEISVDLSDNAFIEKIHQAKSHIEKGDIFQVVLSREFSLALKSSPFDVYRALRFTQAAAYGFYLETDTMTFAGASPEKLVSFKNGILETAPLAGTYAKGNKSDEDTAQALLTDEKENAEHIMLVDLGRNDLGKVAAPGSVSVSALKTILSCQHVMHLSSTIEARLAPEKDIFDAIQAVFPAGTLSGAPKVSAMHLIDKLEISRRGIYGGIMAAINSEGDLETCIVIRTVMMKDQKAYVRAGAGIVFDSIPEKEAAETRHKARAALEAIILANGESYDFNDR